MKVLWITSVMPSPFASRVGLSVNNIQGWVPSLIAAVRQYAKDIDLSVACDGPDNLKAEIDGVKYYTLGLPSCDKHARVKALVAEVRPDIIHLHGSENVYPSLPTEVWGGVPVAMSLQGVINGYYQHYMGGLLQCELKKSVGLVRRLGVGNTIGKLAQRWVEKDVVHEQVAFKNVKYVFGRTDWDHAWAKYLNSDVNYYEVGELMRDPFYQGGRSNDTIKPHTIYCSAAFGKPLKGGHWLLKAVANLRHKYPDIRLRVAGGMGAKRPTTLYGKLRQGHYARYIAQLIDELELSNYVDLLPSLPAEQVADELRRAEVFCLPSLVENSPNSLGEAMLLGVPSLVADVGGNSSLLKNGVDGLAVPSADPAVLADAIDKLFSDREYARKLGDAGYASAVRRYDKQLVVNQLRTAYTSILEDNA